MTNADRDAGSGSSLLIVGGRVIDPESGRDEIADVAIADGKIVDIGPKLDRSAADEVIDAEGCLVTPGLIDPHVHLREPGQEHKETIATGAAAAARGGFTTVCCMPNTAPTIDSVATLDMVQLKAKAVDACRVFAVGAATIGRQGEQLSPIADLINAGAVGISDDGDGIECNDAMLAVLEATHATGAVFMQHCQDPSLTRGSSMHDGDVSARLGLIGWPPVAEEIMLERDVRLNRRVGCRYHAQHLSCAGSVEIIRRARADGQSVSGEASPHHLHLTHEACDGFNTMAKMNPPLREQADVNALREGVADGTITVLATDHAPHTSDEKAAPFEDAPFGIIGLESALPLYAEALVATGAIDWPRLIALMTIEPAKLCGLENRGLGSVAVHGPADITIIDPAMQWTLTAEELAGKSSNTPFLGRSLTGRAVMTIVAGVVRNCLANAAS